MSENELTSTNGLSILIDEAAAALTGAKTSADFLYVIDKVDIAYNTAKLAERMAKKKDAHDAIIGSCQRAAGNILIIEAQARRRLAQEYTAAQKRGEVATRENNPGSSRGHVPDGNMPPATVADLGLTRKIIHHARAIDAAEKAHPGIVQEAVEAKVQAGEFPTRADVMKAVKEVNEAQVTAGLDAGKTRPEIAAETGIPARQVRRAAEKTQQDNKPQINRSDLSMTAQQKLDLAIRQHTKKLDEEFAKRLHEEVEKRCIDLIKEYKDKYAMYQRVIQNRKGHIEESVFKNIRYCLHPDRIHPLQDETLYRRFERAFVEFSALEKVLLDEKGSPTSFTNFPTTPEEWAAMKAKTEADRRAKRNRT